MQDTHTMQTAIDCPSLGRLRSHLDLDDAEVAGHLDECQGCRATIVTLAANAGTVRGLLAILHVPDGVEDELGVGASDRSPDPLRDATVRPTRSSGAGSFPAGRRDATRPAGWRRRRLRGRVALLGGAVVVATLGATVGAPVVAQVLDSFRTRQVRPVAIDPASLDEQLTALEDIADVEDVVGVRLDGDLDDLAAAAELARVPVPDASILGGAVAPRVRATSAAGVRVSFGLGDNVPAALRGTVVEVVAPGTMLVGDATGEVFVAASRAVEVTATGASLDEVRETLLADPDLSTELRDELAAIEDWRTTLPVPVPVDPATWQEVEVAGSSGFAIGHGDDLGLVVWQDGDVVHAVGGERSVDELIALAGRL